MEQSGQQKVLAAHKPPWLRVKIPGGQTHAHLRQTFRRLDLNTVCQEARCPNLGECWRRGTATLMLLGSTCTRSCRFCGVSSGHPRGARDEREPDNVARAVEQMGLAHVVLTMVNRDDLEDGGAAHVAATVQRVRARSPHVSVETLVGDFGGDLGHLRTVVWDGRPDVFAHNAEVVPQLQRTMRDVRCSFERSIQVLSWARQLGAKVTKSSLMVGCGETPAQVREAMRVLRAAGVDLLTIGQYLRPSQKHAPVARYVEPSEFNAYRQTGLAMGFRHVAAGPLVRSSYRAADAFWSARRPATEVQRSEEHGSGSQRGKLA